VSSIPIKGNTSIDASVGVAIICQKCYIKSDVVITVTTHSGFNLTQAISSFNDNFTAEVKNITHTVVDEIKASVKSFKGIDFDLSSLSSGNLPALPTINGTLNLDTIASIPETQIELEFNGLELYMNVSLQLSAGSSYTLNLYDSKTVFGVGHGSDRVGVVFSIDLVLSVDAELDISSGFHILMNDGFSFSLDLFEPDTDKINMTM
jgi:predicted amino acid-binding ACT domain protein